MINTSNEVVFGLDQSLSVYGMSSSPTCNIDAGETRLSKAAIEANACMGYSFNLEVSKWEEMKDEY